MLNILMDVTKDNKFESYSVICRTCLNNEVPLFKCSNCKLVYYCSIKHQQTDWPNHKQLCEAAQRVNSTMRDINKLKISKLNDLGVMEFIGNFPQWLMYRKFLIYDFQEELKRELSYREKRLFYFPANCNVCFKLYSKVISCDSCGVTTYCSDEHKYIDKYNHVNYCDKLKYAITFDRLIGNDGFAVFGSVNDIHELPDNMTEFADKNIFIITEPSGREEFAVNTLTESFTIALTIISVLERSGILKGTNQCLTLHIIGPSYYESTCHIAWEYIIHYFNFFISLRLVFIWPGALSNDCQLKMQCKRCINKKFIEVKHSPKYYDDYMASFDERPDIIMAFNSNFDVINSDNECMWIKSLYAIFTKLNQIFAFTSVLEETAVSNMQIVSSICDSKLIVLTDSEENRFKSNVPVRTYNSEANEISYMNYYTSIIKTMDFPTLI